MYHLRFKGVKKYDNKRISFLPHVAVKHFRLSSRSPLLRDGVYHLAFSCYPIFLREGVKFTCVLITEKRSDYNDDGRFSLDINA